MLDAVNTQDLLVMFSLVLHMLKGAAEMRQEMKPKKKNFHSHFTTSFKLPVAEIHL